MKRKLMLSLTILISSCLIVLAGGGGGKSGGGGGGGGSTAPEWTATTLTEYWYNASLGANTFCGTSFPRTNTGSNTCPTIIPQTISSGTNFYCKIIVQSLENPSEIRTFCRGFYNTTQIEIPYRHTYKISYEYLEGCSSCMSPGMLTLPLGEGRRISWTREKSFNRFALYPDINPGFGSLKNCQ